MEIMSLLGVTPIWLVVVAVVVGLLVGSFLNVVIYRLPLMLEAGWKQECRALLELGEVPDSDRKLDLCWPSSHCPLCKNKVAFYYNIPLLGFLLLFGKCWHCKGKISLRYPLVELLSGVASGFLMYHYGLGAEFFGSLLFTWILIPLLFIDLDFQLLPDNLTLPLLWLGLAFNLFYTFASLADAVQGAMIGYLFLWALFWIFKWLTKKEGMGYGDFKLLAALAAWTGWQYLLVLVLMSALLGVISSVIIALLRRQSLRQAMPYGPALAISGWITLVFGPNILYWYWQLAGINP